MSPDYRPGHIIDYPYLWQWQQERGESDGRKPRPVCVVAAVRGARDDLTHLALLAITTSRPGEGRTAMEIPEIECRRAGLSGVKRAWVVIDEYNYDIAERSWYLEPSAEVSRRLSKSFMMKLAAAFAAARPAASTGRGSVPAGPADAILPPRCPWHAP